MNLTDRQKAVANDISMPVLTRTTLAYESQRTSVFSLLTGPAVHVRTHSQCAPTITQDCAPTITQCAPTIPQDELESGVCVSRCRKRLFLRDHVSRAPSAISHGNFSHGKNGQKWENVGMRWEALGVTTGGGSDRYSAADRRQSLGCKSHFWRTVCVLSGCTWVKNQVDWTCG